MLVWVDLVIVYVSTWYSCQQTVSHPGNNRAWRMVTLFSRRTMLTTMPRCRACVNAVCCGGESKGGWIQSAVSSLRWRRQWQQLRASNGDRVRHRSHRVAAAAKWHHLQHRHLQLQQTWRERDEQHCCNVNAGFCNQSWSSRSVISVARLHRMHHIATYTACSVICLFVCVSVCLCVRLDTLVSPAEMTEPNTVRIQFGYNLVQSRHDSDVASCQIILTACY